MDAARARIEEGPERGVAIHHQVTLWALAGRAAASSCTIEHARVRAGSGLAIVVVSAEAHRQHAGHACARHIAAPEISDVRSAARRRPQRRQRALEGKRVRLWHPDLVREDRDLGGAKPRGLPQDARFAFDVAGAALRSQRRASRLLTHRRIWTHDSAVHVA